MKIFNSLSKKAEEIVPFNPPKIGMYTCGMTVYDYAHIGHGRKYVMDDVLRRALEFNGFQVNHVQNVTDVGHLVSDSDEGEDKLEKGARKMGKTVWEVAQYFTDHFYSTMDKLNILRPHTIAKATDHIAEQVDLVKRLIEKGYAYDTEEAVYFDVSKFSDYGNLFGQNLEDKKTAVRQEVQTGEHKKSPIDFALWFKRVGRFSDHAMHWPSPWGEGFPGWHVECSAMSMKYLGEQFDIHTGGEDHKPIHHPNEIAQSEAATGKHPFAKYWVHHAFLMVDSTKMSKSLGNFYTIEDVINKGYSPMDLRYLYLTTHYRKQLNFTWAGLDAAKAAREKLARLMSSYRSKIDRTSLSSAKMEKVIKFQQEFKEAISNDLNTPEALAVVWEVIKSNIPDYDKYDLLISFDEVLGLQLNQFNESAQMVLPSGKVLLTNVPVSDEIVDLVNERETVRQMGDYTKADEIRAKIAERGYIVEDLPEKIVIKKQGH